MITPFNRDYVRKFVATLTGTELVYVLVDPPSGTQENYCEENARAVVRKFGGECVYGWHISEWPGLYLTGRHHVVWRTPNGILVDVTPHGMGFTWIAFAEDPRITEDFCKGPTQSLPLNPDPLVAECLALWTEIELEISNHSFPSDEKLQRISVLNGLLEAKYGPEQRGGPFLSEEDGPFPLQPPGPET